jgi:hypothetical protein
MDDTLSKEPLLTSGIGENMSKRWSKEQCRRRYVEGDRIGLEDLAIESGVSIATLKRWSCSEEVRWPNQKRRFDTEVKLLSHKKSVDRVSGVLAISNEQVIAKHLKIAQTLQNLSNNFLNSVMVKINSILTGVPEPEQNQQLLELLIDIAGRCPLAVYSDMARLAIQIERQALYLDLADPTILERVANRHGLTLIDLERTQ